MATTSLLKVTTIEIFLLTATISATSAAPGGNAGFAHLEVLKELQLRADSELYQDMVSVADWVEHLMREDGSYAESSAGGAEKIHDFRLNAPPNPYKVNMPNSEINSKVTVHFSHKADLTELMAAEYRKNPPGNWQQPPGTVTVLSNGESMFLIWGAGAAGRPIAKAETGETRIIVRFWR